MSGRAQIYGLLTAMIVFVALALWVGPIPMQDAFVSHDYARHVAVGDGFVINTGDAPTEGYQSLMWVLVCAALFGAGLDAPTTAPYVSLLFGVLCVVLLWDLLRRRSRSWEFSVPSLLLYASAAPIVIASMTGTDASLFAALLLGCVWCLDRMQERPSTLNGVLLALVAILTVLCRFEGVIAAVLLMIVLLRASRASREQNGLGPLVIAGVVLVAVLAYHGWRAMTFGQALPDFLLVRIGVNGGVFQRLQPFDILPFGMYYLIVAVVTAVAFRLSARTPGERFGIAAALVLGTFYLVVKDPTPGLANHAALLALALVPWPHAHRALMGAADESPERARTYAHLALISVILFIGIGHVADNRVTVQRIQESENVSLRPLGQWLAEWRPGLTIAADVPGIVTYYADGHTLDLRERSRLGAPDRNRARALVVTNPDVVLLGADGIIKTSYDPSAAPFKLTLRQSYRVLAGIRTAWSHDRTVVIHVRRDIPELTDEIRDTFPEGIGSVVRVNR